MSRKKPNFGSPVIDTLNKESLKHKEQRISIVSTGFRKNAEIILDVKTARIIRQIFDNKWSVNWKTREKLDKLLADHIEACTK